MGNCLGWEKRSRAGWIIWVWLQGQHCKTDAKFSLGKNFSTEPVFLSLRWGYPLQFKKGTFNQNSNEFKWGIKVLLSEWSINRSKNIGIYSSQRVYYVLVRSYNLFYQKVSLATFICGLFSSQGYQLFFATGQVNNFFSVV